MAQQHTKAEVSGKKITAMHVDAHTKAAPCSIGMIEALAGVNPHDEGERATLWGDFVHLYSAPHPTAMNAVMKHCKKLAAQRVNAGELTLWHPWMQGGVA